MRPGALSMCARPLALGLTVSASNPPPPCMSTQLVRAKAAELESLLQRLADVNDAIPAHGIGMARSHTVRPEAGRVPQAEGLR